MVELKKAEWPKSLENISLYVFWYFQVVWCALYALQEMRSRAKQAAGAAMNFCRSRAPHG